MLQNCNREVTAGNQPAAGGGVNDEQAAKLLREDILRDVGQRACLLDTGGGDDTGQGCGAGLACRALRWAGHVSEVLYGLANAGKSGGICELE